MSLQKIGLEHIAAICSSAIGWKGDTGCGCNSTFISGGAASLAASTDEVASILHRCGKNPTMRGTSFDLVLLT